VPEDILAVTREKSIARLQLKHVCQFLECPLWFPPSIRLTVRPYLIQSRQRHAFVVRRVERCLRTGPDPVQSHLRQTNAVQIVLPKEVFASKTYKPLRLDLRIRLAGTSREAMQGKCLDMLIAGYCEKEMQDARLCRQVPRMQCRSKIWITMPQVTRRLTT
jgi:hypothetical protein